MARPKEFDRNRALDKAMRVFWCKGYEATSIQDIVEAMGVSRQSIYDTFGDKHHLFIESLDYYEGLEGGKILAAFQQPGSAKASIRAVFELVLDKSQNERQLGCLMVNTTVELPIHDTEVVELVKSNLVQSEQLFHRTLLRAEQQGEFSRPRDLSALGAFLFNSFNGLRVTSKAVVDRQVLQHIVDVTLSVLD